MKLVVNGADLEVDDRHAKTPLLWVLRDVLGLHGTKFGCGAGFCAACTVLIDVRNTKSCHDSFGREHSWGRLHYFVRESNRPPPSLRPWHSYSPPRAGRTSALSPIWRSDCQEVRVIG
ncbi:MAG: 2Fe-2S iron-sulfur cluster binding domain-containing protein, partial [Solirubrobacterales bacterium]|nr:2Fe-2S iron-sulfur cluster binding domain-containing protein [Solirubrobacterales bacterium]